MTMLARPTVDHEPALLVAGLFHVYLERDVRTLALKGVDLELERGTWTAVMGPSGSGKSTLLHAIAGLLDPTAGSIQAVGQDLTRLPPAERAAWRQRNVGVILQRDNLHPLLDVAENVDLPLRIEGVPRASAAARVATLLEQVGLTRLRHSRVGELSGGEAQRAAMAVALGPKPAVLLADEPTGELDDATAAGILDLIRSLIESEGSAVLTVTHDDDVAARADRIVRMRDGALAEVG